MFKVIIQTSETIKHAVSTLNRQIISSKSQQIQYSPKKSPCKQSSISPLKQKQIPEDFLGKVQFHLTKFEGNVKLFHQYKIQKVEDSFNQFLVQNKKLEMMNLTNLRTEVLGVFNIFKEGQTLKQLIRFINEAKDQVIGVDLIESKQLSQFSQMVIYFESSIISEEFYNVCYRQIKLLPVYLKQVIILQQSNAQQLSYQRTLSLLSSIQLSSQAFTPIRTLSQTEENKITPQQRQWIQLPTCVNCLLKLQYEVSGIDEKILYSLLSEKDKDKKSPRQNKFSCITCKILSEHSKLAESHRKMSFEIDHQKSQKHAHCEDCKEQSDVWICMVCGSVGCGRYKNADAYKHFVKSGHIITIDLETQRVWNYVSDCFSHKLLKNVSQPTKNVKFPQLNNEQGDQIQQSKLQAAFWQYCSVFSEEMERQRIFYENIKKSQQEKFILENQALDKVIKQLQKQNQQKSLQLRRSLKKKTKLLKKQKQIEEKVTQQRDLLKQYEDCLSQKDMIKDYLDKDEEVSKKLKELQELQKQLNEVLAELSIE